MKITASRCGGSSTAGDKVMRNFDRHIPLVFIAFLFLCASLSAQNVVWKSVAGPPGGRINSVQAFPDGSIFASASTGFFRSTDGGIAWVQYTIPSPFREVNGVEVGTDGIWYAACDNDVYRSTDQGGSWNATLGQFSGFIISSLAFDSTGNLYAGCGNEPAIFRMTAGGPTWSRSDSGLTDPVKSLAVNSGGTVFAAGDYKIFRSTDRGLSWTESDSGLTGGAIGSLIASPHGYLFAGSSGVYKSSDDGKSWIPSLSSIFRAKLSLDRNGRLYAGTADGKISRSTDDGSTWKDITGDFPSQSITALCVGSDSVLLVGTWNEGVYLCANPWIHWTHGAVSATYISALHVDPGRGLCAGTDVGLFSSTDNGENWSLLGLSGMNVPVFCISKPGSLFAPFPDSSLRRSTDGGASWTALTIGATSINSLVARSNGTLYLGEWKAGIFSSTDDGASWKNLFYVPYPIGTNPLACTSVGTLYVTTSAFVYRSADQGTTWQIVLQAGQAFPYDCAIGAGTQGEVYVAIDGGGAYFSPDSGKSWNIENNGLPRATINAFAIGSDGIVFAATDSGVFFTDGKSGSWKALAAGMPSLAVASLAIDSSGYLYAGTKGGGIYRSESSTGVIGSSDPRTVPLSPRLDQNYPNPFNPSTKIHFVVGTEGEVELDVFTILGQRVRTLAKGFMRAGEYSMDFDGSGLSSGVYLVRYWYRGVPRDYVETKAMVLLK